MPKQEFDAATWAELNRLLDQALDLPAGDRSRWLEALDPSMNGLKPQLQSLLLVAAQVETHDFLATLPKVEFASPDAPSRIGQPGEEIGPYRLVREVGSGGMGSVWLAERTDRLIQRPVALKLPHGNWRRAALADRMAREREILSTLDHPNIARLFDAGVTHDGQPFLALEYVEGIALDRYCSGAIGSEPPDLRARLGLFLQVANAVAYAHGKLIVHRDLKPANILVTAEGEARLLDFGIAKLLEEGTTKETRLTEVNGRALTPDYASPEQIAGAPLTVASDLYSLGVILYELLTGTRPYKLKRDSRGALEEAILQADAEPPSAVASMPMRRALRGDLDTIVLKALKKLPHERYPTVNAFAEDIARFLSDRPVLARPDSQWYRLRKFVSRNRIPVSAAAMALLAIVGGGALVLWQARVARIEAHRAEEVKQFIVSIFENADPQQGAGEPLSAIDLLRQARGRLDATTVEDPRLRADLLSTLGESILGLDHASEAEAVLDDALKIMSGIDAHDRQSLHARQLRASAISKSGRFDEATSELDRVIASLRPVADRRPLELASALAAQAQVLNQAAQFERADGVAREALAVSRGARPASSEAISALLQISHANDYLRKSPEAFAAARDAYEMARTFYGNDAHPHVNVARMQYAVALSDRDAVDEAIELMKASRVDAARLYGASSRSAGQYAASMIQYLLMAGRMRDALASSDEAMRILEPLVEPDSLFQASLLDGRGLALLSVRRADEALAATTRAHTIVARLLGPEHEQAFVLSVHRGRELALLGRFDEARSELQRVVDTYGRLGRTSLTTPLHQLGFVVRLQGHPEEAVRLQKQALEAMRPNPRARRSSARILVEMGLAQFAAGDSQAARQTLTSALDIYDEKFSQKPPEYVDALLGLGQIELSENAEHALHRFAAADAYWQALDPQNRYAGHAAYWLSRAQSATGDQARARESASRADRILTASALAEDRRLLATLK